jgi:cell division inhibitor SulA/protein ImuA
MRAATALISLPSGDAPIWRADELPAAEPAIGSTLASGFAELDRELPGGGWPQGHLVELLTDDAGIGELSLLAPALARIAQGKRCAVWVLPAETSTEKADAHALPYAPALAAAGIDLARTIFVRPTTPRESLWAIEQALRAQHLGAVIGWVPAAGSADSDFKALRRLHLLAQRHRALAFVLRAARHAQSASPAALRLQLASDGPRLNVSLLKRRGRPLLEPVSIALRPAHWAHPMAGHRVPGELRPLAPGRMSKCMTSSRVPSFVYSATAASSP